MPAPVAFTRLAELDPHLSLAQLVKHPGLSVRTLRGCVDGPPGEALPCDRIDGGVLQFRSPRSLR